MKTNNVPIYIPSKGRADICMTMKALEPMGINYSVIVEPEEESKYRFYFRKYKLSGNIIILDMSYKKKYETLDDIGLNKSVGPGAARNFAWDHAISTGAKWHWVMDDNIKDFYRLNRNIKARVHASNFFKVMEIFCNRFKNVVMGGPNYEMFVPRKRKSPPYILNTRIYSCNLIRNDIPFRWRGRYNEDTILSLDILKADWCTVQFNAFLQDKKPTQTLKGGNSDEFYFKEGTKPKSKMLEEVHPDVAKVVWKFNRWHHHVDYSPFKKNKLIKREDIEIEKGINNYGMKLVKVA